MGRANDIHEMLKHDPASVHTFASTPMHEHTIQSKPQISEVVKKHGLVLQNIAMSGAGGGSRGTQVQLQMAEGYTVNQRKGGDRILVAGTHKPVHLENLVKDVFESDDRVVRVHFIDRLGQSVTMERKDQVTT